MPPLPVGWRQFWLGVSDAGIDAGSGLSLLALRFTRISYASLDPAEVPTECPPHNGLLIIVSLGWARCRVLSSNSLDGFDATSNETVRSSRSSSDIVLLHSCCSPRSTVEVTRLGRNLGSVLGRKKRVHGWSFDSAADYGRSGKSPRKPIDFRPDVCYCRFSCCSLSRRPPLRGVLRR